MLAISQTTKSDHVLVTLAGVIDEEAKLGEIQTAIALPLRFECSGIKRFNSSGIRAWILALEKLRERRVQFEFVSCPPIFVEQLNNFSNFACGGAVRSVHIPFACGSCGNQFVISAAVNSLKPPIKDVPDQPCPKCKAKAAFDDLAEEYFSFLNRK